MRQFAFVAIALLLAGCTKHELPRYTHEVMNRMTPIKNQGDSETCWIYAMLAAIETEHLAWGDSVNLSPFFIEKMLEQERACPESKRGMGATLIRLIQKYGIVGYSAMHSADTPPPRWVFMLGPQRLRPSRVSGTDERRPPPLLSDRRYRRARQLA